MNNRRRFSRAKNRDQAAGLPPGATETELGVPIPGVILPPEQWARTAIKRLPEDGKLDWHALFGRSAPVVLDLGCGNGRFVISSAVRRPDHDHVGIDILPVVIRYATRRGNQRGLTNVRFAVCGGREFLEQYVPSSSVAEIHVYHPQPFADERDADKRLLTSEFLALVHDRLQPGGSWFLQTDNRPYWKHACEIASPYFDFQSQNGPWPDDPLGRSRREIIATRRGLTIYRGLGRRRELSDHGSPLVTTD